jgi:hypothetical protein
MTNPRRLAVYCINFIVKDVNLGALQQYLHDSADIVAYWNYIPLVYCVKSRLDASELTLKLKPFFPNHFMVAEMRPENLNGWLPNQAWDWFYLNHHEKNRPPAVAGFGGLAGVFGSLSDEPFRPPHPPGLLSPPDKR